MTRMMTVIHPLNVLVFITFLLCKQTSLLGLESLSKVGNMTRCIGRERKALIVFKQGVVSGARSHGLLHSWRNETEDCCKWNGVGCDNRTGHVTHLYLSSQISPFSINSTGVSIGHSLLDLPDLNYLDLSSNLLAGIPEFIGSLTKLVHLDLSETSIAGSFPDHFGNHSNLQYLNLSFSYFDGPIPKFIGSLSSLRYLDLSNTYFTGFIPHGLGSLSKLQHLNLSNNFYLTDDTGNFEWLLNLSSLTHLDLSNINMANSSIWASLIQSIPSISVMRLNHCNLSAPSFTLSNISSSISTLHLYGNYIKSSIFKWLPHLSRSLVELDLGNNMLEGRIPHSFGHMTSLTLLNLGNNLLNGPIPESLSNMTALTHLKLDHNLLNGPIPYSFAVMTALKYLNLSENQLDGMLPKSIYNLSSLQVADFSTNNFTGNLEDLLSGPFPHLQELLVSENQLTGSLPDITLLPFLKNLQVGSNQLDGYLPKAFKHHSALRCLDLSNNHIRGSLPDFKGFSSLELLYLNNNNFSGSIPDFTGCSALQVLRLGENQLTEWETQSTGLLSSLIELDLSMNSICSTVFEAHLSNLSSLKYMRTSFNALTFDISSKWLPPFQLRELSLASCKLGPKFPNWIQNQGYIDHLDLSNSQISDTIPMWFWNFSSIRNHLNLSSNKIIGKFSSELVYVQEIDLSSNYFEGPLPPISAECLKINLSNNKFSGTLLSLSVVDDLSLRFLDISHNELSGVLPDNWMHFQGLVFLNLGFNNFSGRIPTSIGHLVSLQTLILRNNNLYGEIPASLRNCSILGFADFGLNKLSGKIPSWIGEDLPQLYALILKSNRFYGSMPREICYLSNLHFLDISINMISGTIPPCIQNLTAMIEKGTEVAEHIYSSVDTFTTIVVSAPVGAPISNFSYFDNVLARWKGQEFQYGSNFAYLKMIDLSTNNLTGEIPIGVTKLLELKGLNLSGNRFNGKVPLEIGQLKGLECLDLSTNKFSGKIPQSMSGLYFLAFLNLSDNNFLGKIPSGTQLQGFSTSTYEGNPGLCGKPLVNICPGDEPADHTGLSSSDFEIDGDDSEYERWLYISAALGFSTTFWGIIGTLVLHRRWRHSYFFFLENLKERFYVVILVHLGKLQRRF